MAALTASLLATVAATMLIQSRGARAASGEALRFARAQAQAETLLATALVRLDSGEALPAQGLLFAAPDGARVTRQDAKGLIDINAAPPDVLARLFSALGAGQDNGAALADRIADWRDEDDLRRLYGAERSDYQQAGRPPPGDHAFETEGEITFVLGMNPALASCALPFLTTYSGAIGFDAGAAPPALLSLLTTLREPPAPSGAPLGTVIVLAADAPLSQSAVLRRTIWVRLTGDPERPFLVHRGRQELAPRVAPLSECGAPP